MHFDAYVGDRPLESLVDVEGPKSFAVVAGSWGGQQPNQIVVVYGGSCEPLSISVARTSAEGFLTAHFGKCEIIWKKGQIIPRPNVLDHCKW